MRITTNKRAYRPFLRFIPRYSICHSCHFSFANNERVLADLHCIGPGFTVAPS
jgi:hypothetical protein